MTPEQAQDLPEGRQVMIRWDSFGHWRGPYITIHKEHHGVTYVHFLTEDESRLGLTHISRRAERAWEIEEIISP